MTYRHKIVHRKNIDNPEPQEFLFGRILEINPKHVDSDGWVPINFHRGESTGNTLQRDYMSRWVWTCMDYLELPYDYTSFFEDL